MDKSIFALDIGTRSVTGIILNEQDGKYTVTDYYVKEHTERSMLDGQIHNVVAVADVINEVKEKLEETAGPLDSVNVAAAGRALKTIQANASIQLNDRPITSSDTIKHLELSAVQVAQLKLVEQADDDYSNYYCVGYSILHYKLDGEHIGSLIDQSGKTAEVEIIATFLPKVVVESLLAALTRANLEMEALTLEPIAAIQVLIPESMRRLNVALIDIGAGTSDIAITNQGTVIAYGMAPTAGDEITEAISDQYLLDFGMAEEAKRNIVINGQTAITDILGFETTITYEELVKEVHTSVDTLAKALTEEIFRLNKKAPRAVMLIGGGSLTPEITKTLAHHLQLPENRVAVRGVDGIQNLNENNQLPEGPDFITPIGIAIAAKQNPVHYRTVHVNKQSVRMFEMKQLSIGDCLIQAGIEINKYYGKPGLASIITFNDEKITLPGDFGEKPTILLNNNEATVDHLVKNEDHISVIKGANGKEPDVTINELIGDIPMLSVYFNEEKHEIKPLFYVNGELKPKEYKIQDRDVISFKQPTTLKDFLDSSQIESNELNKEFIVFVNNKRVQLNKGMSKITINSKETTMNQQLRENDQIKIVEAINPTIKELLQQEDKQYWNQIKVTFNKQPVKLKKQQLSIFRKDQELNKLSKLKQNDVITIKEKTVSSFIFQDIFRYIDLDLSNVSGHFQLYNNDKLTTFFDPIQNNDQLAIKWEKK